MSESGMNESKPLISVIMPVHNAVKYVGSAINSVLSQTFREFELILVDDGATDGSGELCDVYAGQDSRIRVFHKENGGMSSARNLGIHYAQGKYVTFIDHDDCYLPDFLKKMITLIQESGVQMVRCGRLDLRMDKNESIICVTADCPIRQEALSNSEFAVRYLEYRTKKSMLRPVWNSLYQKSFIEQHQIKFPEELRLGSEDITFNYKMLLAGANIAFVPDLLYVHYRRAQQNISSVFHHELIPVNIHLAGWEREFVQCASKKDRELLNYFQFDEIFYEITRVEDITIRKKYLQNLVSQVPLKGCPLKYYLSKQITSKKVIVRWLRFWLLSHLHCQ